jgi:ribosomal protein S18 acetylase RimI-like enzyme
VKANTVSKIEGFNIRNLKKEDCKEAALIRFEEQKKGFLPAMGLKFYTEILKGTCGSKWGFGKVCINHNKKIIGFIFAATDLKKYYMNLLLRRGIFLSFFALLRVLRNPKLILGMIPYLLYSKRVPFGHIKAEWLTMMVRSEYRDRGVGKELTFSLTNEFRKRNVTRYKSTVPSNNIISCSLHEQFGFQLLGTFDLGGEMMNIYNYEI